MSNGDFWTTTQWQILNGDATAKPPTAGLLSATMRPMQVAQQVFPTVIRGNDNPIPADTVDPKTGMPTSGITRAFATLRKPFRLAPVHVQDPKLTMATNQVNLAAQALALAEDQLFFMGGDAPPEDVISRGEAAKLEYGLLGVASTNETIVVPHGSSTYGMKTFASVVQGIAKFTEKLQGPPYGLILAPRIFADVHTPLGHDVEVTAARAIRPVLASGPLVMSAGMREKTGLLVSLGGKTTTLYVGTCPLVEYNAYNDSIYSFTARESIQFINIDNRSLIYLHFS